MGNTIKIYKEYNQYESDGIIITELITINMDLSKDKFMITNKPDIISFTSVQMYDLIRNSIYYRLKDATLDDSGRKKWDFYDCFYTERKDRKARSKLLKILSDYMEGYEFQIR